MDTGVKLSKDNIIMAVGEELQRRPEILFAYLFGSCVEEETFRDVDVAVYIEDDGTLKDVVHYAITLSLELEKVVGHSVDVVLLNTAPDHLIHQISKGRVVLDRDDDFRTDFITASWKRYFDIQPKRLQALRDILS